MVTQFYHTRDPIENLHLGVTVRKVSAGGVRDGDVPVGSVWSYTFRWQEKKWLCAAYDPKNQPYKTQEKRERNGNGNGDVDGRVETARQSALDPARDHHGVALCSYVDVDNYEPRGPQRQSPPTTSAALLPHIAAAAADHHLCKTAASGAADRETSTWTSNRDRVALRAHREEAFRQMHLVLCVTSRDGGTEDLVLASLRYHPHTGLLCATPGFSDCIVDASDSDAAEKGIKLTTYRISSRWTDAQFEYALDNENDLWPATSLDDQRVLRELQRAEEQEERAQLEEWRNKHGELDSNDATAKLKSDANRVEEGEQTMILMETVSLSGVDQSDPVRVTIDLILPAENDPADRWVLAHGMQRNKTRLSRPVMRAPGQLFVAFGHHVQWVITRPRPNGNRSCVTQPPTLKLTVGSEDSWGRECVIGFAEFQIPSAPGFYDLQTAMWRLLLPTSVQLEEFFLGSKASEAIELPTAAIATHSPHEASTISRLGSQTISTSGTMRVRLHVVESRPRLKAGLLKPLLPASLTLRGINLPAGGVVKRSVEEILQAVKVSQNLSGVRTTASIGSGSNVHAILARFKDQSARQTLPSAG